MANGNTNQSANPQPSVVAPGKNNRPATPGSKGGGPAAAKTTAKTPVERQPAFPLSAAITVVADANPKRPGTKAADKWEYYKGCKTVADVVAAYAKRDLPRRKAMSAIRWDSEHGHITVGK